jgi:hypothetical protein
LLLEILAHGGLPSGRIAKKTQSATISTPAHWGLWIGVAIFLGAITTYLHALSKNAGSTHHLQPWYAALAMGFICAFIGSMAVQKEIDCVKLAQSNKSKLRAMIKLPSGQLVSCMTSNFPDCHLALTLPRAITTQTNTSVEISLFSENYEYPLVAKVLSLQGNDLIVLIDDASVNDYAEFQSIVFTRDANWPLWLPARDADRLLPHWIWRLLMKGQDAFYHLTINSTMSDAVQKLKHWLKLGSKSNV